LNIHSDFAPFAIYLFCHLYIHKVWGEVLFYALKSIDFIGAGNYAKASFYTKLTIPSKLKVLSFMSKLDHIKKFLYTKYISYIIAIWWSLSARVPFCFFQFFLFYTPNIGFNYQFTVHVYDFILITQTSQAIKTCQS